MNDVAIQTLASKMRGTFEAGKPVVAQLQDRWQDHSGLLAMIRWMYLLSEEETPIRQKVVEQIEQLKQDMDVAFATLSTYHGLTQVFLSMAKERQEE
jgi:hypothetical protein